MSILVHENKSSTVAEICLIDLKPFSLSCPNPVLILLRAPLEGSLSELWVSYLVLSDFSSLCPQVSVSSCLSQAHVPVFTTGMQATLAEAAGPRSPGFEQTSRRVSQRVCICFLTSVCFFASCSTYYFLEVSGVFHCGSAEL